ncbi:MAG TPA: tetratricopeptide repeat protein [Planctomycetota bacterium]|nr:tetratricopeptide repeat protein [Planctomycetota bacterium]
MALRLCGCLFVAAALQIHAADPTPPKPPEATTGEDTEYRRAHHLYTLQEYKLATEAFAKYLANFPKSQRAEQARLLLSECYYQLKDLPKAAEHFDKFLNEFPSSPRRPDALQRAVKINWQNRSYAKAVEAAEAFLKENQPRLAKTDAPPALAKQFEDVLFYAGDASYGLKKPDAARGYWERLLKEFPKSPLLPDAAEGLGWVAFEAGKFDEALKQFSVTAATPDHPKAAASQMMAGRALDGLGKSEEALAALEKSSALTGGKEIARETLLWRANILLKLKRYPDALKNYQALAKQFTAHPDTPVALLQAVVQTDAQGQPASTLELCDLYLASFEKGADRPVVARFKARALVALKKPDEALAAAKTALKEAEALPANSAEWKEQRPAALMLLADLSGAQGLSLYQALLKDHADSRLGAPARYQVAYWLGQSEQLKEALAQAEALLKELPASPLPAQEKSELEKKALFAAADFAFRLEPITPNPSPTRGEGIKDAAEKYLQAYAALPGVTADPSGSQLPLVQLRLAWCRHGKGDLEGAISNLDKALAANVPGLKPEMLYLRARCRLEASAKDEKYVGPIIDELLQDASALLKEAPETSFAAHAALEVAQLFAKSKPADALVWLDKLLALKLTPALKQDGLMLRARLRYNTGKHSEALADTQALLKDTAIRRELIPTIYLLQALCYESEAGKEKEAEEVYSALLALQKDGSVPKEFGPDAPTQIRMSLLRRARLRFQAKRWQDAQTDLSAFLKDRLKTDDPAELEAAVLLAVAKKELKDTAGAKELLKKLSSAALSGPLAFEVPFQLGNLAYEAEKFDEAAAQYKKALKETVKDLPLPAVSAAWLNLAWSYRRSNDAAKAESAFAELLTLDPMGPYSAEARYQRGRLLSEAGKIEPAAALWKELLAKQADSPLAEKALIALGQAQARTSQFADAVKTFEQYIAKYPTGESLRDAWCGLAETRLQTKNADGAREAFTKALGAKGIEAELDEVGERALLGLAELSLLKGDAGEAKKLALRVVIDRPDSKWMDAALYFCAKASEDLAEPNQAIGYYRKLLDEQPKSPRADTARERLKALGAGAKANTDKPLKE